MSNSKTITIPEEQVPHLIAFYNSKVADDEMLILETEKKLAAMNELLEKQRESLKSSKAMLISLGANTHSSIARTNNLINEFFTSVLDSYSNPYSPAWVAEKKINYVLEKANEPLTTKEIIQSLQKLEPSWEKDKMYSNVTFNLSTKKKQDGVYYEVKPDNGGESKYGLRKWIQKKASTVSNAM